MTLEQYENAKNTLTRIERLKYILAEFKQTAASMDASLCRMTGFTIHHDGKHLSNINQGELLFLISAFESEINILEHEFKKL